MASTKLDQYPTPAWVAEAIVRQHFHDLTAEDFVVDPTCGPGRFLQAIPSHVRALGVEIDAGLAAQARLLTGREVIASDFFTATLPDQPTVLIGNPPFQLALVDRLLDRAHAMLPEDGRVGLILPSFAFQTANRVVRYSESWSLLQEMIPRNIYPGLSKPLMFAIFRKDQRKLMVGLSLYHEAAFVQALPKEHQQALAEGPASWPTVVLGGLEALGGEAALDDLYEYVAARRPTSNPHWREQTRKICQSHARRTGRGRYALRQAA
ncbi:class I SAM-dependent methyltransferase [Geopseudomonas aromaticivorans]